MYLLDSFILFINSFVPLWQIRFNFYFNVIVGFTGSALGEHNIINVAFAGFGSKSTKSR